MRPLGVCSSNSRAGHQVDDCSRHLGSVRMPSRRRCLKPPGRAAQEACRLTCTACLSYAPGQLVRAPILHERHGSEALLLRELCRPIAVCRCGRCPPDALLASNTQARKVMCRSQTARASCSACGAPSFSVSFGSPADHHGLPMGVTPPGPHCWRMQTGAGYPSTTDHRAHTYHRLWGWC